MPGDSKERRLSGPGARPPDYVNVPSAVAYADVPDALVVTMVRIVGLCWTNRYRRTRALGAEELARLLDRPRSTLYRHLELLEEELGWLRRERRGSRWILHPLPPFAGPVPSGVHGTSVAVQDPDTGRSEAHGAAVAVGDRDTGDGPAHGTSVAVKDPDTGRSEARGAAVAVGDRDRGNGPARGTAVAVQSQDISRSEARGAAVVVGDRGQGNDPARGTAVAVEDPNTSRGEARGAAVAVEDPNTSRGEARGTAVAVGDRGQGNHPAHGTAVAVESCSSAGAEMPGDGPQPSHATAESPREKLSDRQDLIQALAEVGIENPARERIAQDPNVKADWITAWQLWAEHPDRASLSNLPGYIVQCLRHRERPPEQYLRLVRLTPAEKSQLARSRWDGGPDLAPDLHMLRSLFLLHFVERG